MSRIRFLDSTPDRIRKRLSEIEAEERFRRRIYWRVIASLLAITVGGLLCIALGLMSTSPVWGPVVFWAGVLGADIAFALILGWAYLRLER